MHENKEITPIIDEKATRYISDGFGFIYTPHTTQPNIVATRFNSKYHEPWLFYQAQMADAPHFDARGFYACPVG